MREVFSILRGPMAMGKLDRAALEIASLEHPKLEVERWIETLDRHAAALAARSPDSAPGDFFLDEANRYLFAELGFRGNTQDYYDPRNSCLNDVLALRVGLPITLSVLYMEIARRLARPVYGVALPGHFLVLYDDGECSAYLDPFHAGVRRSAAECRELARQASGEAADVPPAATHRHIVLRMLHNLRGAYLRRRNLKGALRVIELLLEVYPEAAGEYRMRAAVRSEMGDLSGARADYHRYLAGAPAAPDRAEVEREVRSLAQRIAGWN